MIPVSKAKVESVSWQKLLASGINDSEALCRLLDLDKSLLPAAQAASRQFPLRVPHGFVARMKKGDMNDPLLKQVLPIGAELLQTTRYSADPLAEKDSNPIPGLITQIPGPRFINAQP